MSEPNLLSASISQHNFLSLFSFLSKEAFYGNSLAVKRREVKSKGEKDLPTTMKNSKARATQVQKEHYSISALFLFQNNSDKNNIFTVNHNTSMDQIWF